MLVLSSLFEKKKLSVYLVPIINFFLKILFDFKKTIILLLRTIQYYLL
ncbi:hypothetical protein A1OE_503 [Candidatus Endolissoclinum faulkneri L2]|uniref:Uncharacterized protein n=1 Tax=Candidatus Endolissoclinum faulkneri L2 TaxID=1193729 RepID=K7ZCL4_9PROT|nr:hypothetical protein A1OE_503 [Candidatus Endolissoclinum faulkneri L2]